MATRSLNRVQLIGNLTRDPELRYTPQGTAVCTFGLATNRFWTTEAGEKREETEFHRIVAWNKLAELCSQLLVKGRKVYVEGRLSTRTWTGQDGNQRTTTEVVIDDMIILDSRRPETVEGAPKIEGEQAAGPGAAVAESFTGSEGSQPAPQAPASTPKPVKAKPKKAADKSEGVETENQEEDKINPDDIPF